jgi:hypothetical protein
MRFHVLMLLLTSEILAVHGATVVSPAAGSINAAATFPFLVTTDFTASVRYQQVYSGSDFAGHGAPQFLITELSFVPGSPAVIDVFLEDIQISFSTTPRLPNGLSSTFAENVGPDNHVVYSGSLHFREIATDFPWPLHIPLQQPFLYDWGAGNLLLDVRNFQTIGGGRPFDPPRVLLAFDYVADTGSSVSAFDVNRPDAEFVSDAALLTRFTVTPVPEPHSLSLVLAGFVAVVWASSRNGRRKRKTGTEFPSQPT